MVIGNVDIWSGNFLNLFRRVTEQKNRSFSFTKYAVYDRKNSAVSRTGSEKEQWLITSNVEGRRMKWLSGETFKSEENEDTEISVCSDGP